MNSARSAKKKKSKCRTWEVQNVLPKRTLNSYLLIPLKNFLHAYQLFILLEYLVYWPNFHDKLNVISILIFTWVNYIFGPYPLLYILI